MIDNDKSWFPLFSFSLWQMHSWFSNFHGLMTFWHTLQCRTRIVNCPARLYRLRKINPKMQRGGKMNAYRLMESSSQCIGSFAWIRGLLWSKPPPNASSLVDNGSDFLSDVLEMKKIAGETRNNFYHESSTSVRSSRIAKLRSALHWIAINSTADSLSSRE